MDITLRGLVVSKYGSAAKLAKKIGWSARKTRDIISERQAPTAKDMEELAEALEIKTADSFCAIFFPNICHNVADRALA